MLPGTLSYIIQCHLTSIDGHDDQALYIVTSTSSNVAISTYCILPINPLPYWASPDTWVKESVYISSFILRGEKIYFRARWRTFKRRCLSKKKLKILFHCWDNGLKSHVLPVNFKIFYTIVYIIKSWFQKYSMS